MVRTGRRCFPFETARIDRAEDQSCMRRSTSAISDRGDLDDYRLLLKLVVPGELCSCIRTDDIAESTDAAIRCEPGPQNMPPYTLLLLTAPSVNLNTADR